MALSITSPYTHSKEVTLAQHVLAGGNVFKKKFYSGPLDDQYGPLTAAATHRAKYWLGYPHPDNVFDRRLLGYLNGNTKQGPIMKLLALKRKRAAAAAAKKAAANQTKQQKTLALAKSFIGYREQPTNLTMFGKWYGLDGNPWCAMFVSYCITKAGGKFHYSYVPSVVADAHAGRNGLFVTATPQPGDAVCFDWNNDGTFDHIGFFDHWTNQSAGLFQTCEGNTLPPGGQGNQSNGGGVYAPERGTKSGYRVVFVRWN